MYCHFFIHVCLLSPVILSEKSDDAIFLGPTVDVVLMFVYLAYYHNSIGTEKWMSFIYAYAHLELSEDQWPSC